MWQKHYPTNKSYKNQGILNNAVVLAILEEAKSFPTKVSMPSTVNPVDNIALEAEMQAVSELFRDGRHITRGQFNKTFTSVIYNCSYCFKGWKR